MKLKAFKKQYSGLPCFEHELAEGAADVTDHKELQQAGRAYLDARDELLQLLEDVGVELG